MKAIVLIDIPEDNSLDMLSPFNTKVTLDYGDKVIELSGDVREVPQKKPYDLNNEHNIIHQNFGYNDCIDKILGK